MVTSRLKSAIKQGTLGQGYFVVDKTLLYEHAVSYMKWKMQLKTPHSNSDLYNS